MPFKLLTFLAARCRPLLFALAVLFAGAAHADDDRHFDELLVFGDSLLDSGNLVVTVTIAGNVTDATLVFTDPNGTLPGDVMSDFFAERLGITTAGPERAGGSNYAVAGSEAQHVLGRAHQYVSDLTVNFNPNALVFINGGANNITTAVPLLPTDPNAAALTMATAAGNINMALSELHDAGAKHIIVSNLPDVSKTPGTYQTACGTTYSTIPCDDYATAAGGAQLLVNTFNTALSTGISQLRASGANIIVADSRGLLDHIIANPAAYGYDATQGSALYQTCYNYDPSMAGGTDTECITNNNYGRGETNADPTQLLFADNVHPTQHTYALNADYLHDLVYAPTEIALLPEIGMHGLMHQMNDLHNHLRHADAHPAAAPRRDCFANLSFTRDKLGDNGPAAQGSIRATGLTAGCGRDLAAQYRLGVAAHLAQGDMSISSSRSTYDLTRYGVAAYAAFTNQPLFINGVLAASQQSIDAERHYRIGGGAFTAGGKTDGIAWGADLVAGYDLIAADHIRLAPAIGYSRRDSRVDGYNEGGSGVSNNRWRDLQHESRQQRAGLIANITKDALTLSGDAYWVSESDNTLRRVATATHSLPGFQRNDGSHLQAHLSLTQELQNGGAFTAAWNHSGQANGANALHFTLRRVF